MNVVRRVIWSCGGVVRWNWEELKVGLGWVEIVRVVEMDYQRSIRGLKKTVKQWARPWWCWWMRKIEVSSGQEQFFFFWRRTSFFFPFFFLLPPPDYPQILNPHLFPLKRFNPMDKAGILGRINSKIREMSRFVAIFNKSRSRYYFSIFQETSHELCH